MRAYTTLSALVVLHPLAACASHSATPRGPVAVEQSHSAEAPTHKADRALQLTSSDLGLRVDLRPIACHEATGRGCPFRLTATSNRATHIERVVHAAPAVEPFVLEPSTVVDGTSDPLDLQTSHPREAWHTGDEASSATTTARLVALAPRVLGVLIDQVAGFEHVKRRHVLLASIGSELREVWRFEESSGPTWSTTTVLTIDRHHDGVLLLNCASLSEEVGGEPDSCEARVVRWDETSQRAVDEAAGPRARAVVLGPFKSVGAALHLRRENPNCLGGYWLLPVQQFAGYENAKGFVLAMLGASEPGSQQTLSTTTACQAEPKGRITALAAATTKSSGGNPEPAPIFSSAYLTQAALAADVPGRANDTFEISPSACRDATKLGCPFDVSFSVDGQVRYKQTYSGFLAREPFKQGPTQYVGGVGDPLDVQAVSSWHTGNPPVVTAATALLLDSGTPALIIDQVTTAAPGKRRHALLAVDNDALAQVWAFVESDGSSWSSVAPIALDAGHNGLLLVSGRTRSDTTGEPDEFQASIVRWDGARRQTVVDAAGALAKAAVIGPFPTLAVAKQLKQSTGSCLGDFWLLPAKQFAASAESDGCVLAAIGASTEGAHRALKAGLACKSGLTGRVTSLR